MGALSFLLGTVADLYMLCFVVRVALYWHGADPRNPLVRVVLRLTNPVCAPLRLLLRPSQRVESHVLATFLVLECLLFWLTVSWGCTVEPTIFQILIYGLIRAVRQVLWFYALAVVAWALLSWFSPSGYSPLVSLLHRVCTPALAPIRRILPGMGGIDFSPMLFFLGVQLILRLLPGQEMAALMSCRAGFFPI